ncbi:MAG: enolase C-terminal domain-like protein, partial [Bacteroidota bacterium]
MKLHIQTFELPLKHTFRISRYERTHQQTFIISLQDGAHTGYGEATTNPYYGTTLEQMNTVVEGLRQKIEAYPLDDATTFWEYLHPDLKDDPFVHCAIDQAAHDLLARKAGLPLYQHWGLTLGDLPLSNYTIGIAPIEEMIKKIKEQPWPVYKIKLGTDHDLAIIQALRAHTDAYFRIDANCAWTAQQTIDYAPQLQALGVEFIEQPLPADRWEDMKRVVAESVLPVIADESCRTESDVDRCIGHF